MSTLYLVILFLAKHILSIHWLKSYVVWTKQNFPVRSPKLARLFPHHTDWPTAWHYPTWTRKHLHLREICKSLDCVYWVAPIVLCLHFIFIPYIPFKGLIEWECELGGERILKIYTLRAFFTKYLYFYLYCTHTTVSMVKAQCFQWEISEGDVQNQNGKYENEWKFNWLKSINHQQNKSKGVHMHLAPIKLRMSQH